MKYLSLLVIVMITGCSSTDTAMLSSAIQNITNDPSKSSISNTVSHEMDEDGWITAYKVPRDNPVHQIDINKLSVKKYGDKVEYTTRVVYLGAEHIPDSILSTLNSKDPSYTPASGDYLSSDVIVDCENNTYGTYNSTFYSRDGQKRMYCPWIDKSEVTMGQASSGSIMEHTVRSACK